MDAIFTDYYAFLKLNSLSNKKNRSKHLPYLYLLIHIVAIRITRLMARTSLPFSISLYPNNTPFNFNFINLSNFKYAYSSSFFSKLSYFYHKTKRNVQCNQFHLYIIYSFYFQIFPFYVVVCLLDICYGEFSSEALTIKSLSCIFWLDSSCSLQCVSVTYAAKILQSRV